MLTLVFLPKWYETTWFKIAIGLAIAGLFYSLYRYRISQLQRQQQIRREIASDLHDDIGSTLNSVKVYIHLVETSPGKEEYLNQIKESLKQASIGLRDMIWVLDENRDTVEEWINRVKQFAFPLANASGVTINIVANGINNVELKKTEKRNLLLIAKEAINNSIKYANCKNIDVTIERLNGKTILIIKDDECGFENSAITSGYGLKNIKERARQINHTAVIHSKKSEGTKISIAPKK